MLGTVVVLYNPKRSEIENINSYKNFSDFLVVMDNSSEDNYEMIKSMISTDDKVAYISHTENIGLCKALNDGLLFLRNRGCDWAVVFDADSTMKTNIFLEYKELLEVYQNSERICVFAPQHSHDRNKIHQYEGLKEIKWAMTSGWLINLNIFFELGGFMEELFVDGLDIDYCYRARENGYKIMECGTAIINHFPAETREVSVLGKKFKYGYSSPQRYVYQSRCLVWLYERYGNTSDLLMYFYKWFKVLFLFEEKKDFIKSMIKGTKEGHMLAKKYKQDRRKGK